MKTTASLCLLLLTGVLLTACQPAGNSAGSPSTEQQTAVANTAPAQPQAIPNDLMPLPGMESSVPQISEKTTILMETTAGSLTIELYPQAAPNAVARFIELVQAGFYDNTPVSRVVPGFVAQFGINWREGQKQWQDMNFNDDPTLFALDRGTLAFAKAGPNSNSTQVFINYVENNRLATPQYNFTTFGKVVSGMEVVDRFVQVGDPSGGLDQGRLWNDGENYLDGLPVKPTMIVHAQLMQ